MRFLKAVPHDGQASDEVLLSNRRNFLLRRYGDLDLQCMGRANSLPKRHVHKTLRSDMKRAFTLLEALITIGIIAVLAAILLPVLVSSKRAAFRTDDISKMHQMGLAAAMYEDRYGDYPLSDTQLVSSGLLPRDMCASTQDLTPDGLANGVVRFSGRHGAPTSPAADYKNTFIGIGEFGMGQPILRDYVLTGPAAGWLIDATDSQQTEFPIPSQWKGTYRRLCIDGSVVVRHHQDFQCYNNGKTEPCRMPVLLYVDPSPYFTELQKSDDQLFSSPQG